MLIPILALGGGLLWFLSQTKRAAGQIDVNVIGVDFDMKSTAAAAFSRVFLVLKVQINNPGKLQGKINQLVSEINLDGETIAVFTTPQPVIISGNISQNLNLVGSVKTADAVTKLLDYLREGKRPKFVVNTNIQTNLGAYNVVNELV